MQWRKENATRTTSVALGLAILWLTAVAPPLFAAQLMRQAKSSSDGDMISMLARVKLWGIQYQNLQPLRIAESALDLIVIDHSLDGRPIEPEHIELMQRKPGGGRRLVVAYLSVGEAAEHRPYWRPEWRKQPPPWLGGENASWPGSFAVRHWHPEWQAMVFGGAESTLDQILGAGFDGVLLDRVDVFFEWRKERASADTEMVDFVTDLVDHARAIKPDFLVIGQNAEPLLRSPRYRAALNAVSKESLLYGLRGPGMKNTGDDTAWSLGYLSIAKEAGLQVLAIEYLDDVREIGTARRKLEEFGFLPFFGNRLLDRLPASGRPSAGRLEVMNE